LSKRAGPAKKAPSGGGAGAKKPKAAPKPAAKPAAIAKKPAKPAPKPSSPTKSPAPKPAAPAPGKPVRKGITIVTPKPVKKPPVKKPTLKLPTFGKPLLGPGGTIKKPLITSGPNAPSPNAMLGGNDKKPRKSPFDKRELAQFKAILLRKRAELVGDVSTMETEALMGQSGSLSHLPQHMAEQGSDAYGQSLSLDLAAADRRLIKEIDDALKRIEDGTYGICELTGKPIKNDRLEELPWARYSIEAARELERRGTVP
jgi:RNA polymerase-binding transcription factor DksA